MRTSRRFWSAAGEARKYFFTLSGEKDNESALLVETMNKFDNIIDKEWITNDNKLFERAVSVEALKRAWYIQKSIPGMMTKGSGEETLSGINEQWFITTNKKLLEGSFKYSNRRRVLINKPGGGTRPLTIANPRIKIIERALLNALEPHFEGLHEWVKIDESEYEVNKDKNEESAQCYRKLVTKGKKKPIFQKKHSITHRVFMPSNYGSRPNRSAHEALHRIKHWKINTTFLIDYDVSKAFDNVNRQRLKNLFTSHIKDARFWLEISKMLNAGIFLELQQIFENKGVAQGSILSPFLFNIYMHELDKKVADLQKLTSDVQKSHESAIYGNLEAEQSYRKISRDFATDNLRRSLKKYGTKEAVLEARKKAYKEHHNKFGRRKDIDLEVRSIQYVRYVDDFLIGIVGSREYASQVRKDINNFVKGNLHLKVKKDNIVHRNKGQVKFLGHMIGLPEFKAKTSAVPKSIRAARKHKRNSIVRFTAADKRLARAKSYEFQANILRQVRSLAQKMRASISSVDNADSISCILAYKELGIYLMKELKLNDWEQLFSLLRQTNLPPTESGEMRMISLNWLNC
jgi:retron-type reverse transcriptase